MEGRRVSCFCDIPLVTKTIWGGDNAGRRFERCATRSCAYEVWIDDPLGARACEAIEELIRETSKLHFFYKRKMDRLREWEAAKRERILLKLRQVEEEAMAEEPDSDEDNA